MILVISGFLITQSFLRKGNLLSFLKRRLIRIFPALIFCIIVSTLSLSILSPLGFFHYLRESFTYVWHNILLYPWYSLPDIFEDNPYPITVNGALWTLPVEVFMYFVIGILLQLKQEIKNENIGRNLYIAIALVTIIWKYIYIYIYGFSDKSFDIIIWGTNWSSAMDLIPYMFIGSLFEVAELKKYCNLQVSIILFILACCINVNYVELLTLIILPYFTMSFALSEKPYFSHCFKDGKFIYGMYLWGFPIQQLLINIIYVRNSCHLSPNIFFIMSIILTIGMSLISYYLFEKPIEQLLIKKPHAL